MDILKLKSFLTHTVDSKEVSLITIQQEDMLGVLQNPFREEGYIPVTSITDLMENIKSKSKNIFYIDKSASSPKEVYDFIVQYPTRLIEIFDKQTMKSVVSTPVYKNVSVVFLVTDNCLKEIINTNKDILSKVGMVFNI